MDGWMFSYMDGWVFSYIQTWNTQIATLYFVINVVVAVKMVLHWNHFHHPPTGDDPGQRLASFSGGRSLRGSGSSLILALPILISYTM